MQWARHTLVLFQRGALVCFVDSHFPCWASLFCLYNCTHWALPITVGIAVHPGSECSVLNVGCQAEESAQCIHHSPSDPCSSSCIKVILECTFMIGWTELKKPTKLQPELKPVLHTRNIHQTETLQSPYIQVWPPSMHRKVSFLYCCFPLHIQSQEHKSYKNKGPEKTSLCSSQLLSWTDVHQKAAFIFFSWLFEFPRCNLPNWAQATCSRVLLWFFGYWPAAP